MRSARRWLIVGSVLLCPACSSADNASELARLGHWGSSAADATLTGTDVKLRFLAGECFGSYASIDHALPSGTFSLPGTYTQLTGVAPGKIDSPAEFSGIVNGSKLSITLRLTESQEVIGPFVLSFNDSHSWPQCLYPVGGPASVISRRKE